MANTYRIKFKDGSTVLIDARSEKHARQAISRGRKVGRYTGRIIAVEKVEDVASATIDPATRALAEDTFSRIERSNQARDAFDRAHG